jgi:3-oxoacyl-[acyl-carrier-protein] synthase III
MTSTDAFISGMSYAAGELTPVENLDFPRESGKTAEDFLALGLRTFALHNGPFEDLVVASIRKSLTSADVDARDVDLLIYASSFYCFDGKVRDVHHHLNEVVKAVGLTRAIPMSVGLGQCTNWVLALQVAKQLVCGGKAETALIIAADRVPSSRSRLVPPDVSIAGDAAATCIVSKRRGRYRIGRIERHCDWGMAQLDPEKDFFPYLQGTLGGIRDIAAKFRQDPCLPAAHAQLITTNLNNSISRLFSAQTGFPTDKVFSANIARFGHCDVADLLINLTDYVSAPANPAGTILLLGSAPFIWSGAELEPTEA